jgi:hypothetical protein
LSSELLGGQGGWILRFAQDDKKGAQNDKVYFDSPANVSRNSTSNVVPDFLATALSAFSAAARWRSAGAGWNHGRDYRGRHFEFDLQHVLHWEVQLAPPC